MNHRRFIHARQRCNFFVQLQRLVAEFDAAPSAAAAVRVARRLQSLERENNYLVHRQDLRFGAVDDMRAVDGRDPLFGYPVAEVIDRAELIANRFDEARAVVAEARRRESYFTDFLKGAA